MEDLPEKVSKGGLLQGTILVLLVVVFSLNNYLSSGSKDTSVQLGKFVVPKNVYVKQSASVLSAHTVSKLIEPQQTATPAAKISLAQKQKIVKTP